VRTLLSSASLLAACVFVGAAFAAKPARPAAAPPLEGKMSQVIDGANFVLQTTDGSSVTVHLAGVDPPEPCQLWATESRDALKDWLQDQPVVVKAQGKDARGRVIGQVLQDGSDLNRRMVEEGHAFSARTKWDHGPYMKEERVAHSLARGMFSAGTRIETPADFRRNHGPCPAAP